ncbi:hypothetical protein EGR_03524 [Echinococcus granulosus]|uniref:Uncharacterized protein n=1 Tax=Echinococcus granulosus TaxID=6210 RepID=W6UJK9_ECHGR|nr:hypothetical protein EGR_03524 [Echinococcus granulosus]EUB61710.1 hypothetical protein EGR_03524 [Echinococcus granulosus]
MAQRPANSGAPSPSPLLSVVYGAPPGQPPASAITAYSPFCQESSPIPPSALYGLLLPRWDLSSSSRNPGGCPLRSGLRFAAATAALRDFPMDERRRNILGQTMHCQRTEGLGANDMAWRSAHPARQDRGGVTAAFEKDDFEAPNVQINFAQHDLACKQRALEHLEQRCLEAVAVEERRRFAELSTCLNPLLYLKPIHYLISPLFLEVAGNNCFPLSSQAQSAPLAALPVGMIIGETIFLPVDGYRIPMLWKRGAVHLNWPSLFTVGRCICA